MERKARVVLVLAILLIQSSFSPASEKLFKIPGESMFYDVPESWTELDFEQSVASLRLLTSSLEYALGSISTYRGEFAVDAKLLLDKNHVRSINKTNQSYDQNVYRLLRFSVSVVSDRRNNKTYRNVKYSESSAECGGRIVEMDDAVFTDVASVDTPKEHLFLESGDLTLSLAEIPDSPSFPIDTVVRVTPPEDELNRGHEGFVDPYRPYDMKSWGNVDYVLRLLEGGEGTDKQNEVKSAVSVCESNDDQGNKWFLYRQSFAGGNSLCVVWGEPSGFLPVCHAYMNSDQRLITAYSVKWRNDDGIYVPEDILSESYLPNGDLSTRQKIYADRCELNEPVSPDQFSFRALGLKEGGLIVDNIQKKIYRYEKGEPVFFSEFNAKWKEKEKRKIDKFRLFVLVAGFAMIGAGIWLRRGRRGAIT